MGMTEDIIKYLKKKDPDFEKMWSYESDDITAIIKYYYSQQLNWCGCGCPCDALRTIAKYLRALKEEDPDKRAKIFQESFGCDRIYKNDLLLCLAYALDAAEFTEHGSSILWPWLTVDGEYFLYVIEEAEKNGELDI
jgi:hypothetical protein